MSEESQFQEFSDKYTKTGRAGQWLLGNFYGAVSSLITSIDMRWGQALEIGAGQGYSTSYIRKTLHEKVQFQASELEPEQVRMASMRNPDVPIRTESVYELQGEDKSIDLVIMLEVLEHLEEPETALSEISRVTRQYAILSVPREPIWRILNFARGKYWKSLGNTPGHINHWSARGFRKFVEPYFKVVEFRTPLPWTILLLKPRD